MTDKEKLEDYLSLLGEEVIVFDDQITKER